MSGVRYSAVDGFSATGSCLLGVVYILTMADAVKKNVDVFVQRLDELLHDKNFWFVAHMEQIEQKTGVKRAHIALGK